MYTRKSGHDGVSGEGLVAQCKGSACDRNREGGGEGGEDEGGEVAPRAAPQHLRKAVFTVARMMQLSHTMKSQVRKNSNFT